MRRWFAVCCTLLSAVVAPPAAAGEAQDLAREVARAYGLERFREVTALRYTFNVEIGERKVRRSWEWHPRARKVIAEPGDAAVSWLREKTIPADHRKRDHAFVNDVYWLLFPFNLVWDQAGGATLSLERGAKLPIGEGAADALTIRYPAEGGYTPGDAYTVFVGPDRRIRQWVFLKGGKGPGRPSTWDDHRQVGPLLISLRHVGPADSGFKLWFTDVALQREGADGWMTPRE